MSVGAVIAVPDVVAAAAAELVVQRGLSSGSVGGGHAFVVAVVAVVLAGVADVAAGPGNMYGLNRSFL